MEFVTERVASEVVQGHVELVAESGVVSVVGTCQRVVEPHGIRCRVEQDGGSYRGLSERGGAAWNPLQRVEQGSGPHHGLPGSLDLSAEARLGGLRGRNGSLSHRSRKSSDIFEVADEPTMVGGLGH